MTPLESLIVRETHKHRYISQAEIEHELEQMEREESALNGWHSVDTSV